MAVAQIEPAERDALVERLAEHFVTLYGAPSIEEARPVALAEILYMHELAEDHDPNTILVVTRELTGAGVRESFRAIVPAEAELEIVAIHGSPD